VGHIISHLGGKVGIPISSGIAGQEPRAPDIIPLRHLTYKAVAGVSSLKILVTLAVRLRPSAVRASSEPQPNSSGSKTHCPELVEGLDKG